MDEADDKIVRLKLSDQVFRRLRQLVASGELSAGDVVPSERALMERFGVGRPSYAKQRPHHNHPRRT